MLMIVLRFTHVVFAALWVGMMAFQVLFLMPSLADLGPDAGKLMAAFGRRRITTIIPLIAVLAIGSGVWLLMRLMGDNPRAIMETSMGKAFAWGGTAAIVAFLLGIIVVRPAMMRVMQLGQSGGGDPAAGAEMQRLRGRATATTRVVNVLLLFALAAMAVARYL